MGKRNNRPQSTVDRIIQSIDLRLLSDAAGLRVSAPATGRNAGSLSDDWFDLTHFSTESLQTEKTQSIWRELLLAEGDDNRSDETHPPDMNSRITSIARQLADLREYVGCLRSDHRQMLTNEGEILNGNASLEAQIAALSRHNADLAKTCEHMACELDALAREAESMRNLLSDRFPARRIFFISSTLSVAFLFALLAHFSAHVFIMHPAVASLGLIGSVAFAGMSAWRIKHHA